VTRIDVLKPVKWETIKRNEVSNKASLRGMKEIAKNGGSGSFGIDILECRTQRSSLILRDVAYVIHANFEMTEKAGDRDDEVKFRQMFIRRASKGQSFQQPYLGCREFAAWFELIGKSDELPEPIQMSQRLGSMFHDFDYEGKSPSPVFFLAEIENGIVNIPKFGGEVVA